jgi:hypothetical protein
VQVLGLGNHVLQAAKTVMIHHQFENQLSSQLVHNMVKKISHQQLGAVYAR